MGNKLVIVEDPTKPIATHNVVAVSAGNPFQLAEDAIYELPDAAAEREIREKWESLSGSPGRAETEPTEVGGHGYLVKYERGAILYHFKTGAHFVSNEIYKKYLELGGPGFCGYPTDDIRTAFKPLAGGKARVAHSCAFQKCHIFWSNGAAFEIHGAIRERWLRLGGLLSGLGFATTDEGAVYDGSGRFNHFQNGSIYWSPGTGAWDVRGAVLDLWGRLRWELGYLGYPTGPLHDFDNGSRIQRFERGAIKLLPDGRAVDLPDTIVLRADPLVAYPVKGWVELTLTSAGGWRWQGRVRNGGPSGVDVTLTTALRFADIEGKLPYWQVQTHLEGPPELSPDRDEEWDWADVNPLIRDNWERIKEAGILTRLDTNTFSGVMEWIGGALFWLPVVAVVAISASGNKKLCGSEGTEHYNSNTGQMERDKSVIIVDRNQPCPPGYRE